MNHWIIPELQTALDAMTDTQVVSLVLYGEARSEPIEGIVAVASVIRNRIAKPARFGDGYRGVCVKPYQFSCLSEKGGKGNFHKYVLPMAKRLAAKENVTDPAMLECIGIAECVRINYLRDNTKGADHYHTQKLTPRPKWALGATMTVLKGSHIFYKDVK